ncbi:SET domain-containing protein [Cucurbitaria berberidis CBS 394.84]|uniref:SET domain-containing protein n=1 Tax=Cucurbitaria berberidis CBS 394.84 TaxID=1168544 RepID=A0A9P4L451_9PLEO|nr:SET domain-containing protein [Cucurbitaria berberidis CBS 394.84]KAF1841085.1 SET domain-containing protein [Cucurbitaria berberidis CBS 394.84]
MPPSLIVKLKSEHFQHPFRQTSIPGKGQGLVASRDIARGSRVLSEAPLLSVPSGAVKSCDIVDAYMKLDQFGRAAFLALCRAPNADLGEISPKFSPEMKHVLFVYATNERGRRIFSQGSRINHSCVPNLEHAWNANIGQGTFQAIKDIRKEDELTISYIQGANWTKEKRQRTLKLWGFTCSCSLCQDSIDARISERILVERQTKLQYLLIGHRKSSADWKQCVEICTTTASSQTVQGTPTRERSLSFLNAAKYSWRLGRWDHAEYYIKSALQHEKICIGTDHPDYIYGQRILILLKTAIAEQDAYKSAKELRNSDDLRELAERWDQYAKWQLNPQTKQKMREPEHDWRLHNPRKAMWWALVDLNREKREHEDPQHVAI